eukprot:GAFH01001309.1.p2 GENE.GAFH01001309.1~~GAFH01001309.1.p2  ORF type:complete len:305 (+),score=121.58 GAFH01001309.1:535-1449(+)
MSFCCKVTVVGIIAAVIIAIVLGSVLGSSVQWVPMNECGLLMNSYTNQVNTEKVYYEGRYFNGPGQDYLLFPRYVKTVSFVDSGAISTQTLDGLSLKLDITFQYQVIPEEVGLLFKTLLRGYETTLKTIADATIRKTASLYRATEFFYNRTAIGNACHEALNATLAAQHVIVPFLQMRKIDLPDSFEEAIVNTEVERQNIEIKQYQQQAATIRAQKSTIDATTDATISGINAQTQASVTLISKQAEADATFINLASYGSANKYMMDRMGFNSTHLLGFLYVDALRLMPDARMAVGIKNAILSTQ